MHGRFTVRSRILKEKNNIWINGEKKMFLLPFLYGLPKVIEKFSSGGLYFANFESL